MIDLTSKKPEEINALIQKWLPALQDSKVAPEHYLQIAYIIDIATVHIKDMYNELTPEWKAWCIVMLRDLYKKNKINNDSDITNIIDDFINDYNLNYESYCGYMASASEYDQQRGFVHGYTLKKGR
jgi:hypothetical protein